MKHLKYAIFLVLIAFTSRAHPASTLSDLPLKLVKRIQTGALIVDLDVSQDGTHVLIATRPNPEKGGTGKPGITLFDSQGNQIWKRAVAWSVRAQAISPDGKLSVICSHDGKLTAIGYRGQTLWEQEETCRPYVLRNHSVICYHDEDFAPDIAFAWYDKAGKKSLTYPISGDILAFAISEDERNIAIGLTGGRIVFLENSGAKAARAVWQKKLPGEVVDIVISSGKTPIIAALTREAGEKTSGQTRLAVLTHEGKILPELPLPFSLEKLGLSADGRNLLVRGRKSDGGAISPVMGAFEILRDQAPRPLATLEPPSKEAGDIRPPAADPTFTSGGVALGGACRDCFLLWNPALGKTWQVPVKPEAILFSVSKSKRPLLAVSLDDGTLLLYRVRE